MFSESIGSLREKLASRLEVDKNHLQLSSSAVLKKDRASLFSLLSDPNVPFVRLSAKVDEKQVRYPESTVCSSIPKDLQSSRYEEDDPSVLIASDDLKFAQLLGLLESASGIRVLSLIV